MYCSSMDTGGRDCQRFAGLLREQVEEAFHAHAVDVVIAGHKCVASLTWPPHLSRDARNNTRTRTPTPPTDTATSAPCPCTAASPPPPPTPPTPHPPPPSTSSTAQRATARATAGHHLAAGARCRGVQGGRGRRAASSGERLLWCCVVVMWCCGVVVLWCCGVRLCTRMPVS